MEPHEPDYSHLPSDVLRLVFAATFSNAGLDPCLPPAPWDLPAAYRQWAALRLTCKHWEEVLCGTPPLLDVQLSPAREELLVEWLPSVPVRVLRGPEFQSDYSGDEDEEEYAEDEEAPDREGAGGRRRRGDGSLLSVRRMLLGLEGVGPEPFWSLAALRQLQVLSIVHDRLSEDEPLTLDTSPLQGLEHLQEVRLGMFTDLSLAGLPASVRRLELWYDAHNQFSMPELPPRVRLDALKVGKKEGVVGLPLATVWDSCRRVDIEAPRAMLGVPCPEPLVRQFERPYREGGPFLPPHILADMELLEQSHHAAANCVAQDLFDGLAACSTLKVLWFGGGSSASLKFLPVREGDLGALPFAFRSQPVHYGRVREVDYLYSVRASELQKLAREWLLGREVRVAEEGVAPPGLKGTAAPVVGLALGSAGGAAQGKAQEQQQQPVAVVMCWRQGAGAGGPPTCIDYAEVGGGGRGRVDEMADLVAEGREF